MDEIPFQVVAYVVVVAVEDAERHHLESEERRMEYGGGYVDTVGVEIEEASLVQLIHDGKEEIHRRHRRHHPSPFLCPNSRQDLCVRWLLHTRFNVSL